MKILQNKYVKSAFRHALNAGSMYLEAHGVPNAWIGSIVAFLLSAYDKKANQ